MQDIFRITIFAKYEFSSVQTLSRDQLFVTPWTTERQASLSITNSWVIFKLMSIESVIPSNHVTLYCLLLLPSIIHSISSVQFSSVAHSCLTLCDPMNRAMPGLPVHNQLPEFTQTHVHRVMPSSHLILGHPLLLLPPIPPSIRSFPMSQLFA